MFANSTSFNTASGKHCCNFLVTAFFSGTITVSIPQAVSTVATTDEEYDSIREEREEFQYRKR